MADVHRVRVEDPRHHLGVGADVGCGNVLLGADLVDDLARVAACEPLLLAQREELRVADDPALGAAERQSHQRALPRHPHREGLDLVLGDRRVIANAPLRGAARHVVDDAVALERPHRAVVHLYGHRDLDALLAVRQDLDQVRVDGERLADPTQLGLGELERVLAQMRRRRGSGGHAEAPSLTTTRLYRDRPPVAPRAPPALPYEIVNGTSCSSVAPPPTGIAVRRRTYGPGGKRPPLTPRPVIPNEYRPGSTSRTSASRPRFRSPR